MATAQKEPSLIQKDLLARKLVDFNSYLPEAEELDNTAIPRLEELDRSNFIFRLDKLNRLYFELRLRRLDRLNFVPRLKELDRLFLRSLSNLPLYKRVALTLIKNQVRFIIS